MDTYHFSSQCENVDLEIYSKDEIVYIENIYCGSKNIVGSFTKTQVEDIIKVLQNYIYKDINNIEI